MMKMEYGSVSFMRSKFLNESIIVYNSARQTGHVYKFAKWRESKYRCCRCLELGKQRTVTVNGDKIVGRKDPEDDHHQDCQPIPEQAVMAERLDRELRNEVKMLLIKLRIINTTNASKAIISNSCN